MCKYIDYWPYKSTLLHVPMHDPSNDLKVRACRQGVSPSAWPPNDCRDTRPDLGRQVAPHAVTRWARSAKGPSAGPGARRTAPGAARCRESASFSGDSGCTRGFYFPPGSTAQ